MITPKVVPSSLPNAVLLLLRLLALTGVSTAATVTPCGLAAESLKFNMDHILQEIVANILENDLVRERCEVSSSGSRIHYQNNRGERISFATIFEESIDDDFLNDHPYKAYVRNSLEGNGDTSHAVSVSQEEFQACGDMISYACFALDQIEGNLDQAYRLFPENPPSGVVPCGWASSNQDFNMKGILSNILVTVLRRKLRKNKCTTSDRRGDIVYNTGVASRERVVYIAYIYEADDDWAQDDPYNYETGTFGDVFNTHTSSFDQNEYHECLDMMHFSCFTLDQIEDNINQAIRLFPQPS